MKIYLIRHANSKSRDGMIYDEACGVSLSEEGLKQAESLAKRLRKIHLDKLYSSPIQRTKETSEFIAKSKNMPIIFDDRLKEHNPSASAIRSEYKRIKNQTRAEHDFKAPDGESFNECAARFENFLRDISKETEESVAVVSHALIIEAFLTRKFNLPKIPRIDETSITLLEFKNNNLKLIFANRTPMTLSRIARAVFRLFK